VTPPAPARALSRASGHGRPAPPVRMVHLGLGNFFRAHQAWYTDRSPDAGEWGIAAFTGRRSEPARRLAAQDGLYTLVTRAGGGDRFDIVSSLSHAHGAEDHGSWLGLVASPDVRVVTLTVTEAGYLLGADGGIERDRPEVQADAGALRGDPATPVRTAPARLVAGLIARRRVDAGPLTLVPCDNLPGNGAALARVVGEMADLVAPGLGTRLLASVTCVTTMVDRITPRTTPDLLETVAAATGLDDRAPVVTEPFSEWVLSGTFAAGRPRWEDAGATFTDDVAPFEQRKLWLLNGAHSLLAYTGASRGHTTVDEAFADEACRAWLQAWWEEASPYLTLPHDAVVAYRAALEERFANPRIRHRLDQIAADGSQKLAVRILPTLRRERAAGRVPPGATRVLGAWIGHLRGQGAPVDDVRAAELGVLAAGPLSEAVRRVLDVLDPALGGDTAVVTAVVAHARELGAS